MPAPSVPVTIDDPTNIAILEISEDSIDGFARDPFDEIARRAGLHPDTVIERVRAMLEAGTIRRVRQTLLSTNLAQGALVAWELPEDKLPIRDISFHSTLLVPSRIEVQGEFTLPSASISKLNAAMGY